MSTIARLRALQASFLILAAIALLAILPARGLPNYVPGEVPTGDEPSPTQRGKKQKRAASMT